MCSSRVDDRRKKKTTEKARLSTRALFAAIEEKCGNLQKFSVALSKKMRYNSSEEKCGFRIGSK